MVIANAVAVAVPQMVNFSLEQSMIGKKCFSLGDQRTERSLLARPNSCG